MFYCDFFFQLKVLLHVNLVFLSDSCIRTLKVLVS